MDIPVVPSTACRTSIVITSSRAPATVNIRVQGSRGGPAQRRRRRNMEYPLQGDGAKPGPAIYEVEVSQIELPPAASRIVSRSPARIELKYEARGPKERAHSCRISTGEPADGGLRAGGRGGRAASGSGWPAPAARCFELSEGKP